MRRHLSAGTIIFNSEKPRKYLLLYYRGNYWDFAKGTAEKDESLKETATREAKEETGLDVEIIDGLKEKIKYFFKEPDPVNPKNKNLVFKEVIFFAAKSKTGKVKISDEHSDYIWLPYKEALEKLKYNTAKEILRKAEGFLSKNQI